METEGVPAGLITYNAALGACDKGGGEWEATASVLKGMKAGGIRPDAISYSAAMRRGVTWGMGRQAFFSSIAVLCV